MRALSTVNILPHRGNAMKMFSMLAVAALAAFAAPAFAEHVRDGGVESVTSNSGSVLISHAGRAAVPAAAGADLYAGDRIVINGDAVICIDNPATYMCLRHANSPYIVKPDTGGDHSPGFLEYIRDFFGHPVVSEQSQALIGRGEGNGSLPFGRAALLPFGAGQTQLMPAGYTSISPLFRGSEKGRAWLLVSGSGEAESLTWNASDRLLSLPAPVRENMDLDITGPTGTVSLLWHIEVGGPAPRPEWLPASGDLDDVQRTERAVWVIRDGPAKWRLFGLTELALLAEKGHFEARHLLEIANNDDCLKVGAPACPFMSK